MKRWKWIIAMAPVMYGLFSLVCWADCLYAWRYNPEARPPTSADHVRAAVVFWGSLLTPLCLGLVAAVVAFRKWYPSRWPLREACIVGPPALILIGGLIHPFWPTDTITTVLWNILVYANVLVGGAIVMALLNAAAGIRHREWGKFALSSLVCCAGSLYLFWLYAFIIYIDT